MHAVVSLLYSLDFTTVYLNFFASSPNPSGGLIHYFNSHFVNLRLVVGHNTNYVFIYLTP